MHQTPRAMSEARNPHDDPEAVRARGGVPNRELTAAEHRQVIAAIEKAVSPR